MKRSSLVIIFVLLAAGTAAMTLAMTVQRPRTIIRDSLRQFREADSFSVNGEVNTVFRAKLPSEDKSVASPEVALPLHIVGEGAFKTAEKGRHAGTMKLSVADELTGQALFGLETRSAENGAAYVKFDGGPASAETGADISSIAGRWFYVDAAASAALGEDEGGGSAWSEFWSDLVKGEALVYREQTASVIIDGAPTWHFILDTRPGAFDKALTDLYGLLRLGAEDDATMQHVRESMAKHKVGAEVWIDKKTKAVRRFGLAVVPPESATISLPVTLVLDFSDYGRPVSVEVPAEVEPLSKGLTSVFSAPAKAE